MNGSNDCGPDGRSSNSHFSVNGRPVACEGGLKSWLAGEGNFRPQPVRVREGDWHHGYVKSPTAFLSIQHWKNGVSPTTVAANWEGEPASVEQKRNS